MKKLCILLSCAIVLMHGVSSAQKTKNKEKSFKATSLVPRIDVSCNDSKPGTLVFNTGGNYRIVLQHLEMADRNDAGLCMTGSKNCWDHLQNYTEGSGRDFYDVAE